MPGSRHRILGHVFSGFCQKMNRTKAMDSGTDLETPLKRCLNTFDITLLGVGHMVGAGIYVLTGTVARELAGPGIVLSFVLAGLTSLLAALCYAEFGTRIPKAGSAYVYTYVSVGEFWAFVIGWNIILEHMIGAASVARAWSGYVDSLLGGAISNATISLVGEMHEQLLGKYPDILAFLVCITYAAILGTGVKGSALVNSALTVVNLGVMGVVVTVGFMYADLRNWSLPNAGFLPFGFSGVLAGAATCFYAFVGFDSIATSGEEARDPGRSIPTATILSMTLVCIGYMLVSAALTLMVPYTEISPAAALPEALASVGLPWARWVVSLGALCGMTTTLLGSLFSLPRCMYSMAADGLIFSFLGRVNKTTQVPMINLAVAGLSSALIALLFDLEKLVEFMSIGTLLAYTIVSASVIILRYRPQVSPLVREDSSEPVTPSSPSGSRGGGGGVEWRLGGGGRLKPGWGWLEPLVGRCIPGSAVSACVFIFVTFSAGLCFHIHWTSAAGSTAAPGGPGYGDLAGGEAAGSSWWGLSVTAFFLLTMISCLVVISAHEQTRDSLHFKVPLVPYIPALSILCNIELMAHLNVLTWLRFMIWMALGLLVYFLYGIHHSKEGEGCNSYSVLLGAGAGGGLEAASDLSRGSLHTSWGAVGKRKHSNDRLPIVEREELPE